MPPASNNSSTSTRTGRSTDPVTAYAKDVVAGRVIACKLAIKACERHLHDLKTGHERGLRFSTENARFAIAFFRFLRHIKGEKANKRVALEPWQEFGVGSMFGWKNADGYRRFRTAYWEVPKKSGKSLLASGIGLYGLVADKEQGSEVYSVATKRDQARIVFGTAREMVRRSPELSAMVVSHKSAISVESTTSKFEPLSSDEKSGDGLNPHFVTVDELHRHKSAALRNLMESGTASRRQPMLMIITTAGDNTPQSAYDIEHDYAVKVLEGTFEDDSYFAFVTCVDDPAKWDDPTEWAKANPNLGVTVQLNFMAKMAAAARASPTKKAEFLRYHCNVRTSDITRAIDMDVWAQNGGKIDLASLKGRSCYLAIDLSSKQDITATLKLFPPIGDEKRFILVPRFFTPEATLEARSERDTRNKATYRTWVEAGFLEATPGNVVDHARVKETILEDAGLYQIETAPYDPWNAMQLVLELADAGVPVVEFIQGLRSYTLPTKEFLNYLVDTKFNHGNNPVLTWMASNLCVQKDKNENMMPVKGRSAGRIDGITSGIMARGASLAGPIGGSYLDKNDLLVL